MSQSKNFQITLYNQQTSNEVYLDSVEMTKVKNFQRQKQCPQILDYS